MRLCANELAFLAKQGWTSTEDQTIAVAVALAESAGETYAIYQNRVSDKPSSGSQDLGLWQINNYYHAVKLQATPAWRDPWVNLSLALRAHAEGGWNLWSTFKPDGDRPASYLAHMPAAALGVRAPFPPPGQPAQDIRRRLGLLS